MNNKFLQLVIVLCVFTATCFGQGKPQHLQNFVSPFKNNPKTVSVPTISPSRNAISGKSSQKEIKIETANGSFYYNLEKEKIDKEAVSSNINKWFYLNENHTFKQISEKTDELGFTHINYQQLYNGIPIDGCIFMTHYKNGIATAVNGQIAQFSSCNTQYTLTGYEAKEVAKKQLNAKELINEYPIELLVARILNEKGFDYIVAYKVRIDANNPLVMMSVYVDANTGKVINTINLIAHADVPGTAVTLYSGTQSITCDSYSGGYRLRDNARKIETYNAINATGLTTSGFTGSTDFKSQFTTWSGVAQLNSFSISAVSASWWYAVFADEKPDLFIKVEDVNNQTVYMSSYSSDMNPPVEFKNLNIMLTDPPYTVEIWDYDAVGGSDLGGSYAIQTNTGNKSWSGNGNSGTYSVTSSGNPALDVHWGMEKGYDFYKSTFNRNSYDGNGSVIKQYLNPQDLQSQYGNSPNNAFAAGSPYNIMVYGMGDDQAMSPVVGLDVEGHEFTHLVVNNNGNGGLEYEGESGALNESFADIFGTCIEFFTNVNPDWLIGEDVMIGKPFMRSMSNPNGGQQPDTYNGQYWANPSNLSIDHGGVHINSGVQNFWFYLLCQGGSGTNDMGKTYSVSGIGISKAQQIAYGNLMNYLGPNATYMDAYNGSLQAAQDLYGNPSTEYAAVSAAWYAVGIGNDPNSYCSGTTTLVAPSGTFTDGSGTANYKNNSNCKWVIAPPGATQIILNFTSFALENSYDTVFIYSGTDTTSTPLTYTGTTLPPSLQTPAGTGAMLIKFKTDNGINAAGWTATYTSLVATPTCDGGTILSNPNGTFNDGSGNGNYGNNQLCYWVIAPPCAKSVTLSFTAFNTEKDYDGVVIFDDLSGKNKIAQLSGSSIPSSITSNTGEILVVFISDYATTKQGFTASYSSTGSAHCSTTTTLNTSDYGTITDGSSTANYCNNLDCKWLIQPLQASSVTLNFTEFDLEAASSDGKSIYDAVEVYDGTTTAAPLLGSFTGSNIPPSITSTGASMLVRFYSDAAETKQGWSAYYTSTTSTYCTGTTTLTTPNGTLSDGSGSNQYGNNSTCSWLIQPANAANITLSFTAFDTEKDYDGVIIYDGADNLSSVLGQFTGSTIPSPITSTGSSMFLEFLSDPALRKNGWTANYTSSIITGLNDLEIKTKPIIFPNPTATGLITILYGAEIPVKIELTDILGKQVLKTFVLSKGETQIDISDLSQGVYQMKFYSNDKYYTEKLVVK